MRSVTFILIAMMAIGCQANLHPNPGMAALRVKVIAEPKSGVQQPPASITTYDTPGARRYGPFARVDYAELDNIVVWIESAAVTRRANGMVAPQIQTIDPAKSSHGIDAVVCVGQKVILRNTASTVQSIYSVSDGNDFEINSVPASGTGEFTVRVPGLIEIFANSSKDVAAQLYATPMKWGQCSHAGQTVEFNNIPPGLYKIVSWHPRLPGTTDTIELRADHVYDATIKVGVNSLPGVSAEAGH